MVNQRGTSLPRGLVNISLPSALLITGTDTGIGKTVITALLSCALARSGKRVAVYKPISTGGSGDLDFVTEAALLAGVQVDVFGEYIFKEPVSPHLASCRENRIIDISTIQNKLPDLTGEYDHVLVEGVGGFLTPLSDDLLFSDLAQQLQLPTVVVTSPRLGTLNHTLLSIEAIRKRDVRIEGLIISGLPNDPSLAEQNNLTELPALSQTTLLAIVPLISGIDTETGAAGDFLVALEQFQTQITTKPSNQPTPQPSSVTTFTHSALRNPQSALAKATNHRPPEDNSGQKVAEKTENTETVINADLRHLWHPFTQYREFAGEEPHPLVIVEGKGCRIKDSEGDWYLDGVSSLWCNLHGHRHPLLDQAVRDQLAKISHSTLLGLTHPPAAFLAEKLISTAPPGLQRVFYSDNGSTAVEVAVKLAYQYWQNLGQSQKKRFLTFTNAYHGDTLGAVSVGGIDLFHEIFSPLLFDSIKVDSAYCYRCHIGLDYPSCETACFAKLKQTIERHSDEIAAVLIEPLVQGAGGILLWPEGYLSGLRSLCDRHNVLLIADEVAVGFGRTGTMFACEQEQVTPDLLTLAKGITGGYLPLAATLATEKIFKAFSEPVPQKRTFFHGHTYTGNPLACAAGLASLQIFEEESVLAGLIPKISHLACRLDSLKELPLVGEIRQRGLMAGIELVKDKKSKASFDSGLRMGRKAILEARKRRVILRPLGDVIVLMPPLAVSVEEIDELVDVVRDSILTLERYAT